MSLDPAKVRLFQGAVGVEQDGDFGPKTLDAGLAKLGVVAPAEPPPSSAGTYDREALRAELRRDEGEKLRAYRDSVGKLSIGIGRNLDDVGTAPLNRTVADVKANGITLEESAALFAYDVDRTEADLDRKLPWWRDLDPARQRVMLNMCFNLGIGNGVKGLTGFVNTLRMVKEGRYEAAAANMLASKWARQVGDRAKRLAAMMRSGRA